jgi:hypothetical protein
MLVIVHRILVALWTKCVENEGRFYAKILLLFVYIVVNGTFSVPSDSLTYIDFKLLNLLVLGL